MSAAVVAYTVNGATHYTPEGLKQEAKRAAQSDAREHGRTRPFGVEWEVVIHSDNVALLVSYVSNGPRPDCGVYRVAVAL